MKTPLAQSCLKGAMGCGVSGRAMFRYERKLSLKQASVTEDVGQRVMGA